MDFTVGNSQTRKVGSIEKSIPIMSLVSNLERTLTNLRSEAPITSHSSKGSKSVTLFSPFEFVARKTQATIETVVCFLITKMPLTSITSTSEQDLTHTVVKS